MSQEHGLPYNPLPRGWPQGSQPAAALDTSQFLCIRGNSSFFCKSNAPPGVKVLLPSYEVLSSENIPNPLLNRSS